MTKTVRVADGHNGGMHSARLVTVKWGRQVLNAYLPRSGALRYNCDVML